MELLKGEPPQRVDYIELLNKQPSQGADYTKLLNQEPTQGADYIMQYTAVALRKILCKFKKKQPSKE